MLRLGAGLGLGAGRDGAEKLGTDDGREPIEGVGAMDGATGRAGALGTTAAGGCKLPIDGGETTGFPA